MQLTLYVYKLHVDLLQNLGAKVLCACSDLTPKKFLITQTPNCVGTENKYWA